VETLTAQLESISTERDSSVQESATLHSRITALQASQSDFDRRLQLEVARVVASTGTTLPARITPAGDTQQAPQASSLNELVVQYEQLVTDHKPVEAAAFYQQHLAKHFTR
jgi:hypothetical protein